MPVDLKEAAVVVLLVQAILCGVYISTLIHCLRWLIFADEGWKYRTRINWPMLIVTIVVSILSTIALVLNVTLESRVMRFGVGDPDTLSNEGLVRVRMPSMFG